MKPKSGCFWWHWFTFRSKYTFTCKEVPNFSTDTPFFVIETENVQIFCDRCLYGHHIVAPTMEGGNFRSMKPRFAAYWWRGGAFGCKYILNCKAVSKVSTVTTNFSIYTKGCDLSSDESSSKLHMVGPTLANIIVHLTSLFERSPDQKPGAE